MNTSFIDISATIPPSIQKGFSNADTRGAAFPVSEARGFENRFQNEISRLETTRKSGSDAVTSVGKKTQVRDVSSQAAEAAQDVAKTRGLQFLSKLEQVMLQISGGDLKTAFMDSQGLDALKKLLLKAGFDSDEVEGLIADLKEKSKTETLKLDDVFDSLSELVVEVDEKASTEAVFLETSALPFVSTLLSELGLTEEEISGIMDAADQGTGGISLDVVIEKLKIVGDRYREAGQTLGVEDTDGSFKTLMSRLDLPVEEGEISTVSINDLISAFETYKQQKQSVAAAKDTSLSSPSAAAALADAESTPVAALLDKLLQSVSLASETESSLFSYQQIKDQFVNELMIPQAANTDKKGLFAQKTSQQNGKLETLSKEIEALLSKNTQTASSDSGRERTLESFGKELKSKMVKTDAVFQGSSGTNNDLESTGTAAKVKSAPRTLPAYVTHQVGRGIVRAVNQGESSLTLQLKPPELGRLTMTIDHHSTGLKVTIVTENHSARDMLASNVNELKSALSSAGISLDSFDVDMNSDFRQSMANAGNQAGQFGRKNGSRQSGFSTKGNEVLEDIPGPSGELVTDGSYHFVA